VKITKNIENAGFFISSSKNWSERRCADCLVTIVNAVLVPAALCRLCLTAVGHYFAYFGPSGAVQTAVGHYFEYFYFSCFLLVVVFLLPPLLKPQKGLS
jgi:hypothetical protein